MWHYKFVHVCTASQHCQRIGPCMLYAMTCWTWSIKCIKTLQSQPIIICHHVLSNAGPLRSSLHGPWSHNASHKMYDPIVQYVHHVIVIRSCEVRQTVGVLGSGRIQSNRPTWRWQYLATTIWGDVWPHLTSSILYIILPPHETC